MTYMVIFDGEYGDEIAYFIEKKDAQDFLREQKALGNSARIEVSPLSPDEIDDLGF